MADVVRAGGKDPFDYQRPTDEQTARIVVFRQGCKDLRDLIIAHIPVSRERSLAITKLEEVSMWGNKGIVFGPE
jgi:hypothetical protein